MVGKSRRAGDVGPPFFVLGLVAGLFCAMLTDRIVGLFLDRDVEFFRAVRELTLEEYVREVDSDQLLDDALRGMLSGLDDHSRFYGPSEIAQLDRETTGEFRGIGVLFHATEPGRILFAYPDSPAARGGLQVGDQILSIDGEDVADVGTRAMQETLARQPEQVELSVRGLDDAERELTLHPAVVVDPTVRHTRMVDDRHRIGYLSILAFSHRTPEEFDDAVAALREEELAGLVVDLRNNPGGILSAAVRVANRFVAEGTIVSTRTRSEVRRTEADPEEATLTSLPLVLLIDEGSASASEVLAGALQDHCVAALVGEPSYGKGTVQTLRRFRNDRAIVKFTTADYFTPANRRIEREPDDPEGRGLAPDVFIELDEDERGTVYAFLRSYSPPREVLPELEAWETREGREVFRRPPADRQLDAAVALLSGEHERLAAGELR